MVCVARASRKPLVLTVIVAPAGICTTTRLARAGMPPVGMDGSGSVPAGDGSGFLPGSTSFGTGAWPS